MRTAHVIKSETEALDIAHGLALSLALGASKRDQARQIPLAELDDLSASGLLGVTVPRAYGGADISHETLTTIFQILAAADPAITQLPQSHFVFLDAIRQDGTEAQQKFFFAEILKGARLGNAQAEKGSSSALDLRTRLLQNSDGTYRLNGTKHYCTGAIAADWIPVAALDEKERLILAYVRRQAPGVQVLTDWNAMGQRVTFSPRSKCRRNRSWRTGKYSNVPRSFIPSPNCSTRPLMLASRRMLSLTPPLPFADANVPAWGPGSKFPPKIRSSFSVSAS